MPGQQNMLHAHQLLPIPFDRMFAYCMESRIPVRDSELRRDCTSIPISYRVVATCLPNLFLEESKTHEEALWTLLAVLIIASVALTGCGTTTTVEEPETEEEMGTLTGTVTLWHAWKESEIVSLTEVIAAFNAMYPDVTVDVLYTPFDDLRNKFETAAATGSGPTVLIGGADWGPGLYDAELVADLTGQIGDDVIAGINPAAMGAVEYAGALVGLPQTIKGVVMFRNTQILPEAPTTYEEMVAMHNEVTEGDVVGVDLEYGFFFSAAHLNGVCGGELMTADGDPTFNTPEGECWMALFNTWEEDFGVVENYNDNDVNLFKSGNVGIIIDGSWNTSALAEAIGAENLAIDPFPTVGDGALSGYVQTENIYLSANAEGDDLAASIAFIEYFLSAEAQALLADPEGAAHLPAIVGLEITDPLMAQAAAAFEGGTAFPVIPEMNAYWDPMNNALLQVVQEDADIATALQEAYDLVVAKVAEIRGE